MRYIINILMVLGLMFTLGSPSLSEARPTGKNKKEASRSPASKKKKAKKDKKKKRTPSSVKKKKSKKKKKKHRADTYSQSPEFADQAAQEISTKSTI